MSILPGASWRVNLKPVGYFVAVIHIHTLTPWQKEGQINTSHPPQSESTHMTVTSYLILWVGVFSGGLCPQTNPPRKSSKHKTVAHSVRSRPMWPCLYYKLNDGWAWLAVGLAGRVTKHAPAASRAKGTLKPALSNVSFCPLAVCLWAGLRSWAAGTTCCCLTAAGSDGLGLV